MYADTRDETGLRMMERLDSIERVVIDGSARAWAFASPLLPWSYGLTLDVIGFTSAVAKRNSK